MYHTIDTTVVLVLSGHKKNIIRLPQVYEQNGDHAILGVAVVLVEEQAGHREGGVRETCGAEQTTTTMT